MSIAIDDFNGENFDPSSLGFFGGGYIVRRWRRAADLGPRPAEGRAALGQRVEAGGSEMVSLQHPLQHQGSVYAHRDNFMDLDPTYKDALGRPMIRLTYNATENDHKMSRYLVEKMEGVIKAMNPHITKCTTGRRISPSCRISPPIAPAAWARPEEQRGEPVLAGLERAQSVRARRFRVPAATRLQSDRHARRVGLLVGQGDHRKISEKSRSAGSRVM